ncbi:type II toxin-antitoxin system VapC family toxin [Halalkalicoccus tibetensis]|uniref:Type II toxin-antitoxin system VapC family toxin n=1 Tax=Halalkalicoccus tibetensis TaxID=175632 RepID=A0ABD5V9K4_9EURY
MANRRLFDASALVDVILGEGSGTVGIDVVFDEVLLDLTRYEAANALWKIAVARDLLSDDELRTAVDILGRLDNEVRFESATGAELHRTMQVAHRDGLTFYNASYLSIAERDDLSLVTEDGALRDAAIRQDVPTETVREIGE